MAYAQYQQPVQSWGQPAQYQGGPGFSAAPPAIVNIQPQPNWGGLDFYRAHAPSSQDSSLFNHAWDRVRQFDTTAPGGLGVGLHEAKHWHRRAYGGMGELNVMGPTEIGHAAAYEAWRTCRTMYETLGPDIERQRESLIGLAVAEAARLLTFAGRPNDQYARSAASDAAAHTASYIFYQRRRDDEYSHHTRGRSRSRARYDGWDEAESSPYEYDDDRYRSRGRSRSRHHSPHSQPRSYSAGTYPGMPYPAGGDAPPVTMYPGGVPSYAGSQSGGMIPPPAPPLSVSAYPNGSGYYPNAQYAHPPGNAYGGYGPSMAPPSAYGGSGVPMAVSLGTAPSTSSSYSYGAPSPYIGSVPSAGSVGMPMTTTAAAPGQTIVIHRSRRHRHHHRRSHSRSRYSE